MLQFDLAISEVITSNRPIHIICVQMLLAQLMQMSEASYIWGSCLV